MPSFVRIDGFDRLACQTSPSQTKLWTLYPKDLISAGDVLAVDDQESLTFSTTRVDRTGAVRGMLAKLVVGSVATVVWNDGSFDEWRVATIDDGQGIGGTVTITCNPLILDLATGADSSTGKGFVSALINCLRAFDFDRVGYTATQMWDTDVIPNCPSWVARGTMDPTVAIPQVQWNRLTPQALALQVRDALRAMNVPCELQLRRNGTTNYLLDLVTQIGASAPTVFFHPRTSLASLKRRIDSDQQATRLFVTGQNDPTGMPGISGGARWLVTAVDGTLKTVTLADPNGGSGPIAMTDQWKHAWLLRTLTGRTFQMQGTDPATQKVTLLAVSTLAVGEFVEFRLTEPLTNARVRTSPSPRFAVSALSGTADYLQLSGNPITVDGQHTDWYMRVWTASSGGSIVKDIRITGSIAATDRGQCAAGDTSGVTTSDFVEIIQLDGAGELPSYLEHPAALATYGMKSGDLQVGTAVGVTNLVINPWQRAWANPSNPPDRYTLLSTFGSPTSQNTNPLFTQYGGKSYNVDFYGTFVSVPRFDQSLAVGNSRLSCRVTLLFSTFTRGGGVDNPLTMKVWRLDESGALAGLLGSTSVYPTDVLSLPVGAVVAPANAWITMEVVGFDMGLSVAPYGMTVELSSTATAAVGRCVAYVDAIEAYAFATNPTLVNEFGDATVIHQTGNRQLLSNGPPPAAYELTIADLERANPVTYGRSALAKGGTVRAYNADIGIDVTVRLLRLDRNLLSPKDSKVGLATLPALLTQLVSSA